MLSRNCYSVNGMTFILFHWSRFLLSESGRGACRPVFSPESCPAFDSSIGRVNYLTDPEPLTRVCGTTVASVVGFTGRPRYGAILAQSALSPAPTIAAHHYPRMNPVRLFVSLAKI
jgi:hypothetical protein